MPLGTTNPDSKGDRGDAFLHLPPSRRGRVVSRDRLPTAGAGATMATQAGYGRGIGLHDQAMSAAVTPALAAERSAVMVAARREASLPLDM
jgi:hypothetical protein